MSVAFKPEEATDALKEYTGQIVAVDYSEKPFGFEGAPGITRKGKVLGIQVHTDKYEKDQFEWYTPSNVKKTKWLFLIEALNTVGAMKDISTAGANTDERVQNFGKSMLGMSFRFQEIVEESLVKEKGTGTGQKKFSVLLPVEYLGKKPIEKPAEVRTAEIGTEKKGGID